MRLVLHRGKKQDPRDVVDEIFLQEGYRKFQNFVKDLVERTAKGTITPAEAYNEFFKKAEQNFPQHVKSPDLRDTLIRRFQLYLQIYSISQKKNADQSK